jgi:hypothetical protein
MTLKKFDQQTRATLGNYVYLLVDPRSATIFYVGKASKNDRPFDHLKADADEGDKAALIAAIRAEGHEPAIHILRHGLPNAQMAEEVEAAVIDAIGLENLTNLCRGKRIERGRTTADELNQRYGARPVKESSLREPFMKIWINQTYSPTMNAQQLYDTTRQFWYQVGLQKRTPGVDGTLPYPIVLALVDNVVVMAYRVEAWFPAGTTMSSRVWQGTADDDRWEFVGKALPDHALVGKRLVDDNGDRIRGNGQGYGYIN